MMLTAKTKHDLLCVLVTCWIWGSIVLAIGSPFFLLGSLSSIGVGKVVVLIFALGIALGSVIAFCAIAYARWKMVREMIE